MNARRVIVGVAAAGVLALSGLAVTGTAASAATNCRYYYDQAALFQVLGTNAYAAGRVYYEEGEYDMATAYFNQAASFYHMSDGYVAQYQTCIHTP